jgi:phosphatidylethanolamine-binding protein (PEBP) family uncharacterized protein
MKRSNSSLVTALALVLGAGACQQASNPDDTGTPTDTTRGTGGARGPVGSQSSGGSSGSTSTGGSTGSSSGGSTGSSSGGSTGSSSGGSTGSSSGGSTGSSSGGSTGSSSGGSSGDAGGMAAETGGGDSGGSTPAPGGAFALTITGFTPGPNGRNCYPPASNSMGNKSPKMDWGPTPAGTKSYVLTTEDKSDSGPHQVMCNITPDITGFPMDIGKMVPPGAETGTRHKEAGGNFWYGPGAGGVRQYEIRIWAMAVDKLPGGCKNRAGALAAFKYLKDNMNNKAVVIATDGKSFWGNVNGACQ